MAKFSQEFLRQMTTPTGAVQGGLLSAVQGAASLPQQLKKRQLMNEVNTALASGDATSISMVRRKLETAGFTEEANKLVPLERQARQQQAASGMLMSAVSGEPLSPEVMRERVGEGLTAQDLASALQIREAVKPKPYFTTAEQIDLAKTFTPQSIAEATTKKDFGLLRPRDDADAATVASKITFWTDPTRPNEGVVLKTLQDNQGRTIELGTRTKQNPKGKIISNVELEGLEEQTKPAVQVQLTEKRETALAAEVGKDIATEVSELIQAGNTAVDLRSPIAEAKLIVADQPDVFGAGAELLSGARRATLTMVRALGVSEDDPLMTDFKNKEGSVDQIRSFTQDFVRKRMEATKGAITEREFDTFIASVPNLLQTPGGYAKLINQMESMNERAILYANSLREARIAENASQEITKVQKNWDRFTADFKYSTFMPPEEQRKLWNIYLEKDGKLNPRNDISFTVSRAGQEPIQMSYGDIVKSAARSNATVSTYLFESYADPSVNISLNPLLDIKVK